MFVVLAADFLVPEWVWTLLAVLAGLVAMWGWIDWLKHRKRIRRYKKKQGQ